MTVKGEARNRIAGIREKMQEELLTVIWRIQRRRYIGGVISLSDLGWVVSLGRGKKILPLLNDVARDTQMKMLFPEQLPDVMRGALNDYLADSYRCEEEIMKRINQHDIFPWVRRRQYPQEKANLCAKIKNPYDVEILLDAHDLSLNKCMTDLEFVTGDKEDIVANKDAILSILRLSMIRYLSSF